MSIEKKNKLYEAALRIRTECHFLVALQKWKLERSKETYGTDVWAISATNCLTNLLHLFTA